MFRRMFVAAAAVVFVAFGVIAGEYKGAITKYEAGKSLTVKSKDGEKVLTIAKDAKIDDAVAKKLEKIGEKGVGAVITTNDKDEVTEIKAGGKKKL
jgi:DNA integrity scanning protein DisA with diadenylate cyclase activity